MSSAPHIVVVRARSEGARLDGFRPGRARARHWSIIDLASVTRWATTCVVLTRGVALVPGSRSSTRDLMCGAALLLYSAVCSLDPAPPTLRIARTGSCVTELLVCGGLAAISGGWSSPYLLSIGGALMVCGLVGGKDALVSGLALLGVGVVATEVFLSPVPGGWSPVGSGLALAVMGGVGLCVRRALLGVAGADGELDRLRSALQVHELLLDVYARASESPSALTARGTVAALVQHIEKVFAPDVVLVLLRDPTSTILDRPWAVAGREGVDLPSALADEELPDVLHKLEKQGLDGLALSLLPGDGVGTRSATGIYLPLRAGSETIGLVAVERAGKPEFKEPDVEALRVSTRHIGQVVENARLFGRLRVLGADDERERFARELHDRVGQSLAAIAVAVDRAAASSSPGGKDVGELRSIAAATREVIRDVREKLTDLRTEPADDEPLATLLLEFARRVEARSGVRVGCVVDPLRLSQPVEREVWRIACEAIGNAERHAEASRIVLRWQLEGGAPTLTVADDGNGLTGHHPLRRDAYGLRGMRERAEIIGARLDVRATPGSGTTVTLTLPVTAPGPLTRHTASTRSEPSRLKEVVA